MLLTEEEAKTKWCPYMPVIPGYVRTLYGAPAIPLVDEPVEARYPNCIGSRCMAWRCGSARVRRTAQSGTWRDVPSTAAPPPVEYDFFGYCGLAGEPHATDRPR